MSVSSDGNAIWLTGRVYGNDLIQIAQWFNNVCYGYAANYWNNSGRVTAADYNSLIYNVSTGNGGWWNRPSIPGNKNGGWRIQGNERFNKPSFTFTSFQHDWGTGVGDYTIPPGCTSLKIDTLFGGGGGGGTGVQQSNGGGGGGGGAGSWVMGRVLGTSAGQNVHMVVGGGGVGSVISSDGFSVQSGQTGGGDSSVSLAGNTIGYCHGGNPGGDANSNAGGNGGAGGNTDGYDGSGVGNAGGNGVRGGSDKTGSSKTVGGDGGSTAWGGGGSGGNSSNGYNGQSSGVSGTGGGGGGNDDGAQAQYWGGGNGVGGIARINFNT